MKRMKMTPAQDSDYQRAIAQSHDESVQSSVERARHYDILFDRLRVNGYQIEKVDEDGDWFLNAIITVKQLRRLIAKHLEENKDFYASFSVTDNYDEECQQMRRHGVWQSGLMDLMPQSVANIFQADVLVIASTGLAKGLLDGMSKEAIQSCRIAA
jgi:hypothetical protein